jgi:argininosuccinate lyase
MPRSEVINDWRLFAVELRASRAYLDALREASILEADETEKLKKALEQIEAERKTYALAGLDMFKVFDTRLLSLVGGSAAKLMAGRSQEERLLTALRLWLVEEMQNSGEKIADVQKALLSLAETQVAATMPAYANMRPAQPVSAAHWLLSFFWMLARDQDRIATCIGHTSISPLGSGFLAGSLYDLDRAKIAQAIQMTDVSQNSMDAVSDWDFALEYLFTATMTANHISRLAEDLILYSSNGVGFVALEGDPLALARMRSLASLVFGQQTGMMVTLKALPSAYNQDAPQNRNAIYMAADALIDLLEAAVTTLRTLSIQPDRMWEALDDSLFAHDLVDYLNIRGQVGSVAVVRRLQERAEKQRVQLADLPLSDFQAESPLFGEDVFALFDFTRSIGQHIATGGTAPAAVRAQIRQASTWLTDAGFQ